MRPEERDPAHLWDMIEAARAIVEFTEDLTLEVKAGMDPVHLKKTYGDSLVLHGGLNAMLWDDIDQTEAEIRRLLPILKQNGGYIFQEDHSIPDSVSLRGFPEHRRTSQGTRYILATDNLPNKPRR